MRLEVHQAVHEDLFELREGPRGPRHAASAVVTALLAPLAAGSSSSSTGAPGTKATPSAGDATRPRRHLRDHAARPSAGQDAPGVPADR